MKPEDEGVEKFNIKVKYVKKATQWCTTYFIKDKTGKLIQRQSWSMEKPE